MGSDSGTPPENANVEAGQLLDMSDDLLYSLDHDGSILYANARCQSMLGGQDSILGRKFEDFIIPEDRRHFISAFDKVTGRGSHEDHLDVEMISSGGEPIRTLHRMIPKPGDPKQKGGLTGKARPLTGQDAFASIMSSSFETLVKGMNNYPESLVVLDENSRVLFANDAMKHFIEHMGLEKEAPEGKRIAELYPDLRPVFRSDLIKKAGETFETQVVEGLSLRTGPDTYVEGDVRIMPLGLPENRYIMIVFTDRTFYRKAARDVARLENAFQAMVDGAFLLGGRLDLPVLLKMFTDAMVSVVPSVDHTLVLFPEPGGGMQVVAAGGSGSQQMINRMLATPSEFIQDAMESRTSVVATLEPDAQSPFEGLVEVLGIPPVSALATALQYDRDALGVLVLVSYESNAAFNSSEQKIIDNYAALASVAIGLSRIWEQGRERAARLEVVSRLVRGISSMMDMEALLVNITRPLEQILPVSLVALLTERPESGHELIQIEMEKSVVVPVRTQLETGSSLLEKTAGGEGQPVIVDLQKHLEDEQVKALTQKGLKSLAILPLVEKHRVMGGLILGSTKADAFNETELATLALHLGTPLSVAISQRRMYDELHEKVSQISTLHELEQTLLSSLSTDELARSSLMQMGNLSPTVHVGAIYREPETQDVIEVTMDPEKKKESVNQRMMEVGSDLFRWPDLKKESHPLAIHLAGSGFTEALAVPLATRDNLEGVLWFAWDTGGNMRKMDTDWIQDAAVPISLALENARLYTSLEQSFDSLKDAQEELVRKERLAAVGRLAAMIAHEVRNPLTVIYNSTSSLRKLVQVDGDTGMLLGIIEEEGNRLGRMVDELLEFARPAVYEYDEEVVSVLIDEAVDEAVCNKPENSGIEVIRNYSDKVSCAMVDRHRMKQALINLINNAAQAMNGSGTLTLGFEKTEDSRSVISISDTGVGISGKSRSRIFEPFFTTKPSGVGLGLSIVRRVVEEHRAEMAVETEQGKGTTFRIIIPASKNGEVSGVQDTRS